MAFRVIKRKDIKKQSYYVWFLGAKESKGLRGEEYIQPVLSYLLDKERELEPMKVTLQVSNKGIKIIQNVPRKNNKGKTEQIKHFIPHHAITCVVQEDKPDDDIVCAILLLYNPLTKCPVHVHAYRCDSVETATTLRSQLQTLIDRPENQKKFREIENRLAVKGLLPSRRLNSDGRSTHTDGSDPLDDSFGSDTELPARKDHVANLYDSLAAELRERLNNPNNCPILLPPKDYETASRHGETEQRKNLQTRNVGLQRRPRSANGRLAKPKESSSSGKSSGIGSDEALSSAIQEVTSHPDFESKEVDPDTSSDEEDWPERETLVEDEQNWRRDIPRYRPRSPSPTIKAPPPILPTYSDSRPLPMVVDKSNSKLDKFKNDQERVKEPTYRGWKDNSVPFSYHLPQVSDLNNRFNRGLSLDNKARNSLQEYNERSEMYKRNKITEVPPSEPKAYRSSSQSNIQALNRTPSPPPTRHVSGHHSFEISKQRSQPEIERDRPYMYDSRLAKFLTEQPNERPNRPLEYSRRMERSYHVRPSRSADPISASPEHASSRRPQSPESYPDRPARRPVERYIDKRRSQAGLLIDEQKRRGYFDLPVNTRDYRHSFAESAHHRVPLNYS
ncbi:uncharacterized protein LOC106464466 [Limulus polyphemus]|uniref:Uncharacterized protein LOC106464466 n=1 Tax=Limulus polyphemus TaxID=6850 RepID=A0ABM1BDZ4_LIMPO|nr:uncharacterized protein LOC106464466 [Limulus polyphemus]